MASSLDFEPYQPLKQINQSRAKGTTLLSFLLQSHMVSPVDFLATAVRPAIGFHTAS